MNDKHYASLVSKQTAIPVLSSRGQAQYEKGIMARKYQKIGRDSYDPVMNPNGIINLGVAENTLLQEELGRYFEQNLHIVPSDFAYADGITGTKRLSNALSTFFNLYFRPVKAVSPDHCTTTAGSLMLLAHLSKALADVGDGILIVGPYYHGFDVSLAISSAVVPVTVIVPMADMFTPEEFVHLERALLDSDAKGINIKAITLTNPHNPMGQCYSVEMIEAYCAFCEKHNLHLISDEMYALSVFSTNDDPHPQPFISVLSIDLEALGVNPSRVHVLYGMSKDFNANGFRAAVVVTQANPDLVQSLMLSTVFTPVSSLVDNLWSTLLADKVYLPKFIEKNRFELRKSYEYVTSWLKFHHFPYLPSNAGNFLLVDMRTLLSNIDSFGSLLSFTTETSMHEREELLTAFLLEHKVSITAGAMMHVPEDGWIRFTFSLRRDYLNLALERLEAALRLKKWSGFRDSSA